MEALRRVFLIIGTLVAVIALYAPAPVLYHAEQPDFARELQHHPFPWDHKDQTPDQYREQETRGLVLALPGEIWQNLVRAVQNQPEGYLKANAAAIHNIIDLFTAGSPVRYLRQEGAGPGNDFRITEISPHDFLYRQAPYLYRHPYALWSPLFFIAGLLLYIFLPRKKFTDDTLCYGAGFQAVIGPDLVGWMFVSGFFTLGLGVGLSAAPGGFSSLLSSNLILPMLILWAFTLFGLFMFKTAARYSGTGLRCTGGRLIHYTPVGTEKVSVDEIASVEFGHWQPSRWVTRLGFLISLVNWRAMGPALLNASRRDPQLEVHLKNGKTWTFILTGAQNVKPFLVSLKNNNIKPVKQFGRSPIL